MRVFRIAEEFVCYRLVLSIMVRSSNHSSESSYVFIQIYCCSAKDLVSVDWILY